MLKALFKKQFLESVAFLLQDKKGNRRTPQGILGFCLLLVLGLGSICFLFFGMGNMLSGALSAQGLEWVYFAFMGTAATAFGVVGSIFTAKTKLYEAKDNDLLLSMPIPSWMILFVRTVGLYLFTLLFEAMVFLPSVFAFFLAVEFSFTVLICSLIVLLVMPFLALAICYILGWLLAVISAKLPWKNLLTTLFSVGFLVAYFIVYSKINTLLNYVMINGDAVGNAMQKWLYPFSKMGAACAGDWLALLVYAAIFLAPFALVYLLISKTYLRLATARRGGRKAKYTGKGYKQTVPVWALVKKELMRFTKNPMVALNCLLGAMFLMILPFILLFSKDFRTVLTLINEDEIVAMILAIILCALTSTNMLAAASVSLEGESIWVIRSLPVQTEKVLFAKGLTHWLVTAIPAAFASAFCCILLKISVGYALATLAVSLVFSAFAAAAGLAINLKLPNMHWTNELVAVKQSFSAVLSMFAEWAAVGLLVGGYFLFGENLFAGGYLLVCVAMLTVASGLIVVWIGTRGKKIFEEL